MTTVFVPGTPIPQGSAKGFRAGTHVAITHDNPKTRPWRADVQAAARGIVGDAIAYPDEPVLIALQFIMPRRAAEPKRVTPQHTRKPDLDKLERAILDALSGIVYRDDAQVVHIAASKRTADIGEQPGARITWSSLDDD